MQENTVYFDSRKKRVQWQLNEALYNLIARSEKSYDDLCIFCIGTDRSTGDSFGPLCGHMLSRLNLYNFRLFGTFEQPVHAITLPQALEQINPERSLVIAVDASVGNPDYIGYIGVGSDPVRPGSGLGKELPEVGDISLTGIVAMGGVSPFLMLQNASLGLVYHMSEDVYLAFQYCLYRLQLRRPGAAIRAGPGILKSNDIAYDFIK